MAPNGNCWGQFGIVLRVPKNRTSESSPSFRKDVVPIWQNIGFFMEFMSIHMESYGIYVATYLYFSPPPPLVTVPTQATYGGQPSVMLHNSIMSKAPSGKKER